MDLIPPALVVARYFPAEQEELDQLQLALEQTTQELDEYVEEHGVEGGLLDDVVNDKGKVTKAAIAAQIKDLRGDSERADELEAAKQCGELLDAEVATKTAVKGAQHALDTKTLAEYDKLTEDDIKLLVIDNKWIGSIEPVVFSRVTDLVVALIRRLRELEERYRTTLADMSKNTDGIARRVDEHLDQIAGARRG